MHNSVDFLSPEEIEKKQNEIAQIDQTISNLHWEMAGEPEDADDDFYEAQYRNSPEAHLDSLYDDKELLEEQLFKDDYYKRLQEFLEMQNQISTKLFFR